MINRPAGVMLTGYLLFGLAPVFVKQAAAYDWMVAHTLLARFGFAFFAIGLIGLWARVMGVPEFTLRPHNYKLLFLRGLLGGRVSAGRVFLRRAVE